MTSKNEAKFHQKQILSPQDRTQNRSLETVPSCSVSQYYPLNNTVGIHMCDEGMISVNRISPDTAIHEQMATQNYLPQVQHLDDHCGQ